MLLSSMRTRFKHKTPFFFWACLCESLPFAVCQCICVHFMCVRTGRTLLDNRLVAVLSSSISFVLFASPPRKQNANVAVELQEKLNSHTRHHKIENSFEIKKFFLICSLLFCNLLFLNECVKKRGQNLINLSK